MVLEGYAGVDKICVISSRSSKDKSISARMKHSECWGCKKSLKSCCKVHSFKFVLFLRSFRSRPKNKNKKKKSQQGANGRIQTRLREGRSDIETMPICNVSLLGIHFIQQTQTFHMALLC